MDKSSIAATLRTNGYLTTRHSRLASSHSINSGNYQQNQYPPHVYGTGQQNNDPPLMSQQPSYSNNPWNSLSPAVTPELMNMVSTIMTSDTGNPNDKPTAGGDPAMNLMMQVMGGSPQNSPVPMSVPGNPPGLSGGLLEFYLKNGGGATASSGRRSLNPGSDTMMDAYIAGLLGPHGSQSGQSINPNMLYFLLNSKKDGKGLDMNTLLHLGLLPFGKPTQGGGATNPFIISSLLGDGSNKMSDTMKFALMQGLGNGGNNMATAMLMSNLLKNDESEDNNNNNFLMMSMLSNLMNKNGQNQYPNYSPYANSNRRNYQNPTQSPPRQQHFNIPYQSPRVNPPRVPHQNTRYSNSDKALVDRFMSSNVNEVTLPYCPYNFVRIGHFPDLSDAVRGCCKVFACHRTKKVRYFSSTQFDCKSNLKNLCDLQMTAPAPFQKPTYTPWTGWTSCDKTCGAAAYRTRVRICKKKDSQPNTRCDGPARQFDKCKLGPCQLHGMKCFVGNLVESLIILLV